MFQQHHGESLSEEWTRFNDLLQKVPHHGIDLRLQIQIFYDHVSFPLKREIDHAAGGKLRDKSAKESWEIIENLALYDHKSWNDPRDFAKPVKAITLPQDGSLWKKVLVREEVSKPVTKYVNAISLVRMENDKGKEGDEVVDKNIVEPIELVENEEAMDDVKDNELDKSVNEDSTRWGKVRG
ncbi:hypothetical protein Tco_0436396 [Tanacetum coccineum]